MNSNSPLNDISLLQDNSGCNDCETITEKEVLDTEINSSSGMTGYVPLVDLSPSTNSNFS